MTFATLPVMAADDLDVREHVSAGADRVHERPAAKGKSGLPPWLGELGGVAVFATGAAYALGYSAQSAYYSLFGLTPEEVGVDKISALLRITPLAALFGFATTTAVAGMLWLGRMIYNMISDLFPRWKSKVPSYLLVSVVLIIPLFWFADSENHSRGRYDQIAVEHGYPPSDAILTVGLLWLVLAVMWWVFSKTAGEAVAGIATSVMVVAVACIALWEFVEAPTEIRATQPKIEQSARLALVGIPQAYAEVQWKNPSEAPEYMRQNPRRIYLLIGQNSGRYLLYEYCDMKIYTVSDSQANVIRSLPPGLRRPGKMEDWYRNTFPCDPRPSD